jgi:hypothetical protein
MDAYDDPQLRERLKRELGLDFKAPYIELKESQREALLACAYETNLPFSPGAMGSRAMVLYERMQRAELKSLRAPTTPVAVDARPARRPRP